MEDYSKIIQLQDFVLVPFCLVLILLFSKYVLLKNTQLEFKKLFWQLFMLKIVCFVFYLLLTIYYYKYFTDTITFYFGGQNYSTQPEYSFINTLLDLLRIVKIDEVNPATETVYKISYLIGKFFNGSYISIALVFTYMSLIGTWYFFKAIYAHYPETLNKLKYFTLFWLSIAVWTSAIFKDPLTHMGLGIAFYALENYQLKKFKFKHIILLIVGLWLMYSIRSYVFIMFIGVYMFIRILLKAFFSLNNPFLKLLIGLPGTAISIYIVYYVINNLTSNVDSDIARFSLESVVDQAKFFQDYYRGSDAGSAYKIGEFDGTPLGFAKQFPLGIVTALYRPFLWEARSALLIPTAIESFILLLYTFYLIIKYRLSFLALILKNNLLLFLFTYSIFICGFIALTISNYGSLSRYKSSGILFFTSALVISHFLLKSANKKSIPTS